MKRSLPLRWLVAALLAGSLVIYVIDWMVSPALRDQMPFYIMLDLAFVPVSGLIVGFFINRLIAQREREQLLHKMYMVIGAFFSQTGHELLCELSRFDVAIEKDRPHLLFSASWKAEDFARNRDAVRGDMQHEMRIDASDLDALKALLVRERPFVLGLLQNGNLLEHSSFTDTLWAVSHLSEELSARRDLSVLPPADRRHIELDMSRAFGRLLGEWLFYVHHLQVHYPYLFSFAVRSNPFDPNADIEVQG